MSEYEECLSWTKARGLMLDPRIERKQVKGIYGMYATQPIPEGTVFGSFPIKSVMPFREEFVYPEKIQQITKWIHAAAIALKEGKNSSGYGYVAMFEPLEAYHQHSSYFFNEEELSFIKGMSPLCYKNIIDMKLLANTHLSAIKKLDPDLDENLIIQAILNSNSRIWGEFGFLPVLDLFNHSLKKGTALQKIENTETVGFKTKCHYDAGDQIWISYGPKDLFTVAVNFNYFDPNTEHFVDYGLRSVQTISNRSNLAVAEYIATLYKSFFYELNGQKKFRITEDGLFFMEDGPCQKLIDYFAKTSFCTQKEFLEKKCSNQSIATTMTYIIDSFLSANNVDNYKFKNVPKKLHRFHQLLKKEKRILLYNRTLIPHLFKVPAV